MREPDILSQDLFREISDLINSARKKIAVSINTELSILYWSIGRRIQTEILQHDRAEYGESTFQNLSDFLTRVYGKGWSEKQLRHCLRSAEQSGRNNG